MIAVDVIDAAINKVRQHAWPQTMDLEEARAAVADAMSELRACRDMLRESAKQHRLAGDSGHARHCDLVADGATAALANIGAAP